MSPASPVPAHIPARLVFDFDIYTDQRLSTLMHRDYHDLVKEVPDIFWTPRNGGHWVATGFDVISEILKDPEHFSSKQNEIPKVENPPVFIPLDLDPPHNLPYRQALMSSFSPKAVRDLETKIRHWASRIVDEVAGKGQCDFIRDVSSIFPVSVFMELMGMPLDRLLEFRNLSEGFFNAHSQDADKVRQVAGQIIGTMMELAEQKRREPAEDLMSRLVHAQIGGRPISSEELQSMFFLLFLGGMHTVTNALGFAFRHLGADPHMQSKIAADPGLIPSFVEESLRLYGVINAPRLITGDFERFGVPFRRSDMVLCLMALTGRDQRKNSEAERFLLDRDRREFLTFSTGTHLCLGHQLARSEMRILTEEWFKRIPRYELVPGEVQQFRANITFDLINLSLRWPT